MDNKVGKNYQKQKVVEIPEHYLDLIEDEYKHQNKLLDKMLNVSMKIARFEEELESDKKTQKQVRNEILKITQSKKRILSKIHKKLGLDKEKQYRWEFTGTSFIGTLDSKTKENKKEEK